MGCVWKVKNKKWVVFSTSGASGGVTIFWDALRFKCLEVVSGSFSIIINLVSEDDGFFWLTSIYGSSSSQFRNDF